MTDDTTSNIVITPEELQKIVVAVKKAQMLGAYHNTEQSNEISKITDKVIVLLNRLNTKEKTIVIDDDNLTVEIK
jgi:hypothetical protein